MGEDRRGEWWVEYVPAFRGYFAGAFRSEEFREDALYRLQIRFLEGICHEPEKNWPALCWNAAKNWVKVDVLRSAKANVWLDDAPDDALIDHLDALRQRQSDARLTLHRIMSRLPPSDRHLLTVYLRHETCAACAAELGITKDEFRSRWDKLKSRIRSLVALSLPKDRAKK
jgi:DNA-directed RNA polymerase specialized sigma24 family protein